MKFSHREKEIISDAFKNYIFGIKSVRKVIIPIFFASVVSRVFEVRISTLTQAISERLDFGVPMTLIFTYSFTSLFSAFLIEVQGLIFCSAVQRVNREASKRMFSNFLNLEYSKFRTMNLGEIQQTINRSSNAISEILEVSVLNLIPVVLVILLCSFKILSILGFTSLVILVASLASYTIVTIKMAVFRNNLRKKYNAVENETMSLSLDRLSNYESIVAFNSSERETLNLDRKLEIREKHAIYLWRSFYVLNFLQRCVFSFQTIFIIFFGAKFGNFGDEINYLTSGKFVLYLSISTILAQNLDKLGYMYSRFTAALTNLKMSPTFDPQTNGLEVYGFNNEIEFSDVGYGIKSKKIFEDLTFKIKKGEKIALIGRNGVGKSSLLKCVLGFNEYEGSIKIDGNEIRFMDKKSLRKLVGYVPQDSQLINSTLIENLLYSEKTNTREAVALCKYLNLHVDFQNLKDGYSTIVGERGVNVSGGQKQKIAIVRALLKKSPIILMDEPTASVDQKSELNLMKKIFEDKNLTVIVIVHNLSLLEQFDKILYVEQNFASFITPLDARVVMKNN